MKHPIVKIKEGAIKGNIDKDYLDNPYYSFLGIPYGKAPVKELRFKAPVPVEPWDGVKDCTQEGPECPSHHLMYKTYCGAEDCLHVNVYTPKLPKNEDSSLKPVMVWFHGGGFLYDSNKRDLYGPDYLITEDVVIVTVNYRLGVFGFLSLEDPTLEVPGNAGLKDMVLSLRWIQNNIKNFCGDPNNVTIFGESAGSAAVHYLYLSPATRGLFHKAICQSGCALNTWAVGTYNGRFIAKQLGFHDTNERKILEFLKSLSPQKIIQGQHKNEDPFIASKKQVFGPVVEKYHTDSAFLTEEPIEIIKSGKFNHVPLIIGMTSREGMLSEVAKRMFGEKIAGTGIEDEIHFGLNLKKGSNESRKIAEKIRKFYFGEEEPSPRNIDSYYMMKTDNMFLQGAYHTVNYQKQKTNAPIYFYEMTLGSPLSLFKNMCNPKFFYPTMFFYLLAFVSGDSVFNKFFLRLANFMPRKTLTGACHGDDLSYLFKPILNERVKVGSEEEVHVKRFIKMWANFARTGNPTPNNDKLLNVEWKAVTHEENYLLDIGEKLELKKFPYLGRVQFWDTIYSY